jgi:hypothetical protein
MQLELGEHCRTLGNNFTHTVSKTRSHVNMNINCKFLLVAMLRISPSQNSFILFAKQTPYSCSSKLFHFLCKTTPYYSCFSKYFHLLCKILKTLSFSLQNNSFLLMFLNLTLSFSFQNNSLLMFLP